MGWTAIRRHGAAIGCAALLHFAGPAAVAAATAQELLAAQDKELQDRLAEWGEGLFDLPDDAVFDEPLRQAAAQMAKQHLARLRALAPAWIAQARALSGNPALQGRQLSKLLYTRTINETALWTIESAGPAHDEAWLKAALAPQACALLPGGQFAQRIAMIQAAPPDTRPVLLAGERELLSRWGTHRSALPPRPSPEELGAADQTIALLRTGMAVTAEPMKPFLAWQVFDRDRKPGPPDRWQRCAKAQWWLISQLAGGQADRRAAFTLFRYATMFDTLEVVPAALASKPAGASSADGMPGYPPVANYFEVEGSITVQADTDGQGKLLKARVVSRKLKVPGVGDNPPVAFEALLDAASLELARKRSYPADGRLAVRVDMVWRLTEGQDATR